MPLWSSSYWQIFTAQTLKKVLALPKSNFVNIKIDPGD